MFGLVDFKNLPVWFVVADCWRRGNTHPHTRTLLSQDALHRAMPFGDMLTDVMRFSCPFRVPAKVTKTA